MIIIPQKGVDAINSGYPEHGWESITPARRHARNIFMDASLALYKQAEALVDETKPYDQKLVRALQAEAKRLQDVALGNEPK